MKMESSFTGLMSEPTGLLSASNFLCHANGTAMLGTIDQSKCRLEEKSDFWQKHKSPLKAE